MTMLPSPRWRVKQRIDLLLDAPAVHSALRAVGGRQRQLPPATSIYLLLVQLLHQTSLAGLRHVAEVRATASAICQARSRLPLELFYVLIQQFSGLFAAKLDGGQFFLGLQVVLLDATSFHTQDTAGLAKHYGKRGNQHPGTPGYPSPKLLCLMDYASGLITKAMDLPIDRQEHMLLRRVAKYLSAGQIVLADRGLVSFAFLCELLATGAQACLRLGASQMAGTCKSRRIVRRLGQNDLLVEWDKSVFKGKAYSKRAYALLPQCLNLRQITFDIPPRKGFRPTTITLITTLLDPRQYPAKKITQLHRQRWQVEVYFRDLKRTQGFNRLAAKSVKAARKELLGHVLLYNLIRAVMLEAAQRQHTPPHRLSFRDALRHLQYASTCDDLPNLLVNPSRQRPSEPRLIKGRQMRYDALNMPRMHYKKMLQTRREKPAA